MLGSGKLLLMATGSGFAPGSFLNSYPGAVVAYSLRDLTGLNESVCQVQRSSDDATRDFTATEMSNGTLTTWVGVGNTGHLITLYDQSGNNFDASWEEDYPNTPYVVNAGTAVQLRGLPAIAAEGRYAEISGVAYPNEEVTGFFVGILPGGNSYIHDSDSRTILGSNTPAPNSGLYQRAWVASSTRGDTTDGSQVAYRYGTSAYMYVDGTLTASGDTQPNGGPTSTLELFASTAVSSRYYGTMCELILYPTDKDSIRTAVSANQKNYYGTP